ncbi:MAG: PAS domain-containing protein, partial [Bdellovibrio sp.]
MMSSEAEFGLHELFFSKTDFRGIIQSGNTVFIRVSEYSSEELIQKPHNIIRHSDTPRAVFKLLWDYLKGNKPIVAYVKNRSKAGRYYWVLAMAFPMQDGYLSIRLKPSSSFFDKVKTLYAEMLK